MVSNLLPAVLQDIVFSYLHEYELLFWIDSKWIDIQRLSFNPRGVDILIENPSEVIWDVIQSRPWGIPILEKYPNMFRWHEIVRNPEAINIINRYFDKLSPGLLPLLSDNPAAIHFLEANPEKIDWDWLSQNPAAIHLLEANPEKIDWDSLSRNPAAIHLLEANPDKINHLQLWRNPAAIHLIQQNMDDINWHEIDNDMILPGDTKQSEYTKYYCADDVIDHMSNHTFIDILAQHPNGICWPWFSAHPAAIHLLDANPDKILWCELSTNPAAMHILTKNLDKIDWSMMLMYNWAATDLLVNNPDKLSWDNLCYNPDVVTQLIDRGKMQAQWASKLDWEILSEDMRIFVLLDKPAVRRWM